MSQGLRWLPQLVASEDWKPVENGTRVHAGERLVTGPDSGLTLVFAEGSRMVMDPNSDVTLDELSVSWGRSLHMVASQRTGMTSHSVVPLRGAQSAYQVITPVGVASVHGTHFSVLVGKNGLARFAVDTGKVVVTGQNTELALEAGQAASTKPGLLPQAPDYQFNLTGEVTSIDGEIWTVAGVSFIVNGDTQLAGNPQEGSKVFVEGRITAAGERLADSVTVLNDDVDHTESTFTGILQSRQDDTWLVDGIAIHLTEDTEIGAGIALGMPVKVRFYVDSSGRWVATKIEALIEDTEEPTPTATPQISATPTPTGEVPPTEIPTPTPFTNCTGANPQPKGAQLAAQYGVPYEEIMGWFCQHFGFGEIDLAYGLSRQYNLSVVQIFDLRRSGLGWGQIKQMLAKGLITPTPVVTATLTATLTPTVTGTITVTETPTGTPATPTPLPVKNDRNCPQQANPTARSLAARYAVTVEEIMGWFCRGFGFGEIDRAYSWGIQYNLPPAEIFAMRTQGLGWGQIKQRLEASSLAGTPQPGGPGNGNPGNNPPGHDKTPKPKKP